MTEHLLMKCKNCMYTHVCNVTDSSMILFYWHCSWWLTAYTSIKIAGKVTRYIPCHLKIFGYVKPLYLMLTINGMVTGHYCIVLMQYISIEIIWKARRIRFPHQETVSHCIPAWHFIEDIVTHFNKSPTPIRHSPPQPNTYQIHTARRTVWVRTSTKTSPHYLSSHLRWITRWSIKRTLWQQLCTKLTGLIQATIRRDRAVSFNF